MRSLFISFCLLFVFTYAEAQQEVLRSDGRRTEVDTYLRALKTLHLPYGETPTFDGGLEKEGSIFYSTADSALYIWNGDLWDKVDKDIDLSPYYTKTQTDSIFEYYPTIAELNIALALKVDKTTKVNGHELTGDIVLTAADVGALTKALADIYYKDIDWVPAWSEITNKPTEFTPAPHTHPVSDIVGLQGLLDGKQDTITGGASSIVSLNLDPNYALISNGAGKVAVSGVTATELGSLTGVTGNIQTQIDGKVDKTTTITNNGGIDVGGSLASGAVTLGVNELYLNNRYLRKDRNDGNGSFTLSTGKLVSDTAVISRLELPSLDVKTSDSYLVVDGNNVVGKRSIDQMKFDIANSGGTVQFPVLNNGQIRFQGSGDTDISFNSATNTITINSIPGAGGGGAVTSFNGRTGGVVSQLGDYSTSIVEEGSNLYFTESRVRGSVLTGLTPSNSAILASDNILQAIGKAQGQINARTPSSRTLEISGTPGRIIVSGASQDLSQDREWIADLAASGITAGTYTKATFDVYGRATSGGSLVASDIPSLSASKITSGVFDLSRLGSGTPGAGTYIDGGTGAWTALPSVDLTGYYTKTETNALLGGKADNTITITGTGGLTGGGDLTANRTISMANVPTNTIKGRVAAGTGAPTDLTVAQVRTMLSINNVDNTSDLNKPISTATGTALGLKANTADISAVGFSGSYDDLLDKPAIPLGTVTSVGMTVPTGLSISGSPITSSGVLAIGLQSGYSIPTTAKQTSWDAKEPAIALGLASQYYAGDKTWKTLDKAAVGLGNVDNTSDLSKPISTATQTALNGKEDKSNKVTSIGATPSDTNYPSEKAVKDYVTSMGYTSSNGIDISGSNVITPVYGTTLGTIAQGNDSRIINGQTAYGWGNHADAGYQEALVSGTNIKTINGVSVLGSGDIVTPNNTYTAGSGLTLTGSEFSLPVTVSGTGTFVTSVTQSANGLTVNLGTPTNTTYTNMTLAELNTGTVTTGRIISAKTLTDWIVGKGYLTSVGWDDVTGKPTTFTPSAHTHDATDITSGILNIARIPTGTTASTVALGNHTHTFASITGKPTTISGYGITDAYTKTEVDGLIEDIPAGTVTSVGLSAPTGFSVTNTPVTSTGNLVLGFAAGYSLPTNAKQATWDAKEPAITAGTTAQYWRGDKTWATLNKSAVGLGNVDNTSDLDKPISTATSIALNAKQDTLVSGTTIKTINGSSILGSGNIVTPNDNTTYTAGSGITLTETEFSVPVSVTGTGSYVQTVTQTASGIAVTLGTPPNTTYSTMSAAEITAGTATTGRTISSKVLNDWLNGKNYLTTVAWGDVTDKPTTFTPSAHTHDAGDITSGVLAIARIPTGTTSSTVALGNHTHTFSSITSKPTTLSGYGITDAYTKTEVNTSLAGKINTSEKGAANGVATLGADGKIPNGQIPAIALTETYVVDNQAEMLALSAEMGDVAVRNDLNKSFILQSEPASTLGNWVELQSPSVANTDQVPEGSTNLYFTQDRARQSISASGSLSYNSATGVISYTTPTSLPPSGSAGGDLTGSYPNPTINTGVVTNAKLANMATATIKGRVTSGTGAPQDLTATQVRTLINVADGATANDTDANLKNRANHTGTQAISTITNLQSTLEGKFNNPTGTTSQYVRGDGSLATFPTIPAGTVTSVGLTVPTGFTVTNSPITSSGSINLGFTAGYSLPTTAKQTQWDQAYGWGDHAGLYVPTSRYVIAGDGLTGGGDLTDNVTITLGTPGAITLSSTNSVTASRHTHEFAPGGTTSQYIRGDGSLAEFPTIATYTAGTGLSLTGTTFGQTITTSGTGTFVTGITQTADGFQVNLGTPPNTTYSLMTAAELNTGTATTARTISAERLNTWLTNKALLLSGGTVTGQIKRTTDAVAGDDLPRLSQVQGLIDAIPLPEIDALTLAEMQTGTSTDNKLVSAKNLYDWVHGLGFMNVGSNISLLNNNVGYIVGGTGAGEVRTNTELDLRYLQTELDPTVPSHVKTIAVGDITGWNNKLSGITGGSNVTIDNTNPLNPVINVSVPSALTGLLGDVTSTGTGNVVTTISQNAVTLDKIQKINRNTILGLPGAMANLWTQFNKSSSNPSIEGDVYRGDWQTGIAYAIGDLVYYYVSSGGYHRLYRCIFAHTSATGNAPVSSGNWVLVNPALGGQYMQRFMGEFDPATSYIVQSWVYYEGEFYYTPSAIPAYGPAPNYTPDTSPSEPVEISIGTGLEWQGNTLVATGSGGGSSYPVVFWGTTEPNNSSGKVGDSYYYHNISLNRMFLYWKNASNVWTNLGYWDKTNSGSGGSSTLAGLSDVDVTGVGAGQVLSWTGGIWRNVTLPTASPFTKTSDGLVPMPGSGTPNTHYLGADGTWRPIGGGGGGITAISQATDVLVSSPTVGQVMTWNGTAWQNQTPSGGGGGGGISALTGDVTASGSGSVPATITNSAVTNAKLANMPANTIKGRLGSSGAPQDLTGPQVLQLLNTSFALSGTTINYANGSKQYATISANTSYSLTLPQGADIQVELTNSGSSTITVSFSGAVFPSDADGTIAPGKTVIFSITNISGTRRIAKVTY